MNAQIKNIHREKYELLNPIIDELTREGRIKMAVGKHGDLVSLIDRNVL